MNRAELYGDGFFETIRIYNHKPLLWDLHLKRIEFSLHALKMNSDSFCTTEFSKKIIKQISQSELSNGRCRISFMRQGNGFYTPTNHQFEYQIEISPIDENLYHSAKEFLKAGIYPHGVKALSPFSSVKSKNALLFILAGIHASESGWDDIIILNQYNRICEGFTSNVFSIKNNIVYTPPLSELCTKGIMRSFILENFQNTYPIIEEAISQQQLLESDEIWLTNTIYGVRSVSEFQDRKYSNKIAIELNNQIRNLAIQHSIIV